MLIHRGGGDLLTLRSLRVGQRVLSYAPGETEYGWGLTDTPIDPTLWQVVTLRWQFRDGSWVIGQLLRGPEWFAEHRPQVGDKLRLDLEEMGVSGYAKVIRIEPCPTIEAGPGRVVLSTFEHSQGELYELTFENLIDTIRVTLVHPIWSEDRQSWVRAAELEPGERVRCIGGIATVRALLPSDTERVYNIEVDGDHCYRVGERGVMVHNASLPSWCSGMTVAMGGGSARDVMRLNTIYVREQLSQGQITNNPGSLTATELPIIKRVRARLATGGGSGSSTAVRNLFVNMQYWINGYNPAMTPAQRQVVFQAAYDAGRRDPIGMSSDTVGHIIGHQFGGHGSFPAGSTDVAPDNVFPQSSGNQGWYGGIETMWATSVGGGNTVCVEITLVYHGGTDPARYRPREVRVEWWEECGGTVTHHALVAQAN